MSLAVLSATRLPKVANECSQQTCSFKGEGYNPCLVDFPLLSNVPMNESAISQTFSDQQFIQIASALTESGYVLLADFLPLHLTQSLLIEIHSLSEQAFKPAAIGRDNLQQFNEKIRSNTLHWLTGRTLVQQQYLGVMEQLRIAINRRLFMGLFDFECHYSHYAPGDFYKMHLDAFKGASNRVLSTVLYLNPQWQAEHAGELLLYSEDQSQLLLKIEPKFNDCILFLSDIFPHEVKVTQHDRYSIAGWFRVNATVAGQLDPPR
jgi:SM-20-related protein